MVQPWMVSILSTAYDLKDYRQEVIAVLKKKGFSVSAYELPEFPVETNLHSHDSCLAALGRVDIAIVIIDKRSGGTYCGTEESTKGYTITEAEYLGAIKRGIPVFLFVNKKTYDEHHAYKKSFKKFCIDEGYLSKESKDVLSYREEFDKKYICTYVEKTQTLHFIDDVQNSFLEHETSNWMDFYTNVNELKDAIEGKLSGYSRMLIQRLAEAQKESLLNRHTSTAIGMSLGDVFSSEYYIEAPHKIVSGGAKIKNKSSKLSDEIKEVLPTSNSILIYGEAGYGKTTILAKCFSDHVDGLKDSPEYDLPLFLPLRNKGSNYSFDIEEFIANDMEELMSKEKYPNLNLRQLKIRLYCDGFDELAESLSTADLNRIRNSSIFKYQLVLTCRQQYTTRYLNEYNFSDKFGIRVKMNKWDIATAKNYISNFYLKGEMDKEKGEKIIKAIEDNNDLQELLDSPLLVTMFLWFLDNRQDEGSIEDISRVELFSCWMTDLSKRECAKAKTSTVSNEILVQLWEFIAWKLYLHRIQNLKLKVADMNDMVEHRFEGLFYGNVEPWLDALFECKSGVINGTFHEQFMEYLVARLLVDSCIHKSEPYPEFLQMVVRPEINRYFRGIWKEKSRKEQETIYEAIREQYLYNIGKNTIEAISTRVHAAYHMCRLESKKREESIEQAFNSENHISVRLSLYFGAIKMGRLDREEEFYNILSKDENLSKANRGYHLAYYADAIYENEMPYYDDEYSDWQSTLRAFERHFESDELGHFFLRRIDLLTMNELMKARKKVSPLTQKKVEFFGQKIEKCKYVNIPEYNEYIQKVKKEFGKLVKLFKKFE